MVIIPTLFLNFWGESSQNRGIYVSIHLAKKIIQGIAERNLCTNFKQILLTYDHFGDNTQTHRIFVLTG